MAENFGDNLFNRMTGGMDPESSADHLKNIEALLKDISRNMSQSAASDVSGDLNWKKFRGSLDNETKKSAKTFSDGLEESLLEAFGASNFKSSIQDTFKQLADEVGVSVQDLPNEFGRQLGDALIGGLKNTSLGKDLIDGINKWKDDALSDFNNAVLDSMKSNARSSFIDDAIGGFGDGFKSAKAAKGTSLVTAIGSGVKAIIPKLGPLVAIEAATTGAQILLGGVADSTAKTAQSLVDLGNGLNEASLRDVSSREKMTQLGNERLAKDIETIATQSYTVMQEAADKMVSVWDDAVRVINQTQGYSKEELQTLIGDYAERIRSEGLSNVVSVADFTSSLSQVLSSGLSGSIAEEFAYEATKLNAAIPTQDFFSYAETYASLAANAVRLGYSQEEAIKYANRQLEAFASNLLYSSRELTGGFTTGLQNASDLFERAVEITEAAHTGDSSRIAGVLTSVSAITGAIAPDLASSMVDAIYQAAVGGNSSQLVALRSLAGTNASNTEFLKAFVNDPQGVFSTLFQNLADLQNMSASNYMEVAEGLSDLFGIDQAAFQRIDFNYLAQAIDNMQVSTASLQENINQLASGESTGSAEQMRIRQINEYMIEEGLAYVLDNEAARAIQQHMWDEQIAAKAMEHEYAVNIRGQALTLLTNIWNVGSQILGMLFPFIGTNRAANLYKTITEASALDDTVKEVLEAGKVGSGNDKVLKNLTTYGKQLNLTNSYLSLLTSTRGSGTAGYTWGTIGKSTYASLGTSALGSDYSSFINTSGTSGSEDSVNLARLESNFSKMLSSITDYLGSTLNETVDAAIAKETTRLVSSVKISDAEVRNLANQYLKNPEKYGLSDVLSTASSSSASSLASFNIKVAETAQKTAEELARASLLQQKENEAREKATSSIYEQLYSGEFGQTGYDAWAASASKYGISDFEEALKELGYNQDDVMSYFSSLETIGASRIELERQAAEEKFWEDSVAKLDLINTNIHDVFDKGDIMGVVWPGLDSWLADIDSNGSSGGPTAPVAGTGFRGEMNAWLYTVDSDINKFHTAVITEFQGFRKDWTDYYIKHTTYNQHLTGDVEGTKLLKELNEVKNKADRNNEDVLNALTEAFNNLNVQDLLDPTVQQNLMLAQILKVVQGIFQQNNTQGKLKLPDAISALATGMTVEEL